jgi:hypothetical protein
MGVIVGSYGDSAGSMSAGALHTAFLFPIAGLAFSILLYSRAREYGQLG